MKYLASVAMLAWMAWVLAVGCIPDFEFATARPDGGGSGGVGQVGQAGAPVDPATSSSAMGGGGATSSTTTAGGGGGGEPIVPCGASGADCAPNQLCCFHLVDYLCDHCSFSEDCTTASCSVQAEFSILRCNDGQDCGSGETCCIELNRPDIGNLPVRATCRAACVEPELVGCLTTDDCLAAGLLTECSTVGDSYPGYFVCR